MSQNLNSAGKIAKIFINHPLTGILGIFILILGYFALQFMPKEENPQIKVSGAVVPVGPTIPFDKYAPILSTACVASSAKLT